MEICFEENLDMFQPSRGEFPETGRHEVAVSMSAGVLGPICV